MKKVQVQQGFTLIELMIVVAIIGILAAVAIPSYQDYTKRAHVSEGLSLAGAAKTGVSEYYGSQAAWPGSNAAAGIGAAASINGNAVTSVTVGANGTITVVYNAKVAGSGATASLLLQPSDAGGSIKWDCTGGDVPSKLKPSNCR